MRKGEYTMNNTVKLIVVLLLSSLSTIGFAEKSNMTVDQADSLNVNKFHDETKNQEAIIKQDFKEPWDPTDTKAINAFETEKGAVKMYGDQKTASSAPAQIAKPGQPLEKGQRVNIRELYNLTGKPSASDAANALQGQMASFCPNGFAKHGEWVKPVTGTKDFYLYYQFECIE
jgi:hypothetical protein